MDNEGDITLENLILETMPFSEALIVWCKKLPEFKDALKITHPEKYIHVGSVSISRSGQYPNDEVIGVYSYGYMSLKQRFKHDFIVNLNSEGKVFVLYTRNPKGPSKYVKDIKDFYSKYGHGGNYHNTHWLTLNDLPEATRYFAERAIEIGINIRKYGFQLPSKEMIKNTYLEVIKEKQKNSIV